MCECLVSGYRHILFKRRSKYVVLHYSLGWVAGVRLGGSILLYKHKKQGQCDIATTASNLHH